jgi:hypothetical protein
MKLGDGGAMAIDSNLMGARVRGAFGKNGYRVEEGGSQPLFPDSKVVGDG